jgi:hypothetical protein
MHGLQKPFPNPVRTNSIKNANAVFFYHYKAIKNLWSALPRRNAPMLGARKKAADIVPPPFSLPLF